MSSEPPVTPSARADSPERIELPGGMHFAFWPYSSPQFPHYIVKGPAGEDFCSSIWSKEDACAFASALSLWAARTLLADLEAPTRPASDTAPGTAGVPDAYFNVCSEIRRIMQVYREQEETGCVDTPGGLEHMGDVWTQLGAWDRELASAMPAASTPPVPAGETVGREEIESLAIKLWQSEPRHLPWATRCDDIKDVYRRYATIAMSSRTAQPGATPITPEMADRLSAAIEGELNGFAVKRQQAWEMLDYALNGIEPPAPTASRSEASDAE